MSVSRGPKITTNGLIACFDAGNPQSYPGSGNTWYDISGYGHDATFLSAPDWHEGSGFMAFDGARKCYFDIPSGVAYWPDSDFTYEICLREMTDTGTESLNTTNIQKIPFGNKGYNTTNDGFCWTHASSPNDLYAQVGEFGSNGFNRSAVICSSGTTPIQAKRSNAGYQWHHLTAIVSNKRSQFPKTSLEVWTFQYGPNYGRAQFDNYNAVKNGVLTIDDLYLNGERYGIGCGRGVSSAWTGDIAFVRVYNRKLTEPEVRQNKNAFLEKFKNYE